MRIQVLERQRDGLIYSNEMLRIIRRSCHNGRAAELTQEALLAIR
jgi:hypothetical protein